MDVGSCSSVVRELVAKAGGPGFNSLVNAWNFFCCALVQFSC